MKKIILVIALLMSISLPVHAGWFSNLFGGEQLGSTINALPVFRVVSDTYAEFRNTAWELGASGSEIVKAWFSEICLAGDCRTSWPAGGGGGSIDQLGQIGDVSTSTLAYGNILTWDGSNWQDNATSTLGIDLSDTTGSITESRISDLGSYLLDSGDTATGNYNFDSGTLYVDATNNRVGIGTASPGAPLHVSSVGTTAIQTDLTNTANGVAAIRFNRSGTNVENAFWWNTAGVGKWFLGQDNDGTENIILYTHTPASRNILKGFQSDGDIGLGEKNFNVGDFALYVDTDNSKVGVATTNPWGQLSVEGQGSNPSLVVSDTADNTDFIVAADGKVGVGTESPTQQLHVKGSILSNTSDTQGYLYLGNTAHGLQRNGSNDVELFTTGGNIIVTGNNLDVNGANVYLDDGKTITNSGFTQTFIGFGADSSHVLSPTTGQLVIGNQIGDTLFSNWATTGGYRFYTNRGNKELAVLSGLGYFGLGHTSPTTLLTVGSSTPGSIASSNYYNSAYVSGDLEVDGQLYVASTSTLPQLSVQTGANLFGTYGTQLSDYCVAITGSADLCDGSDDGSGGGSGTVTSVDMTVPTGLTVSGNPITTAGTLAVGLDTGYVIPTSTRLVQHDTAYSWGDHSTQGYLTASPFGAAIDPTELASADFGDFTCNGTTCTLDTDYITEAELDTIAELQTQIADATLLISGGTLTTGNLCQYDGTGIDCNLSNTLHAAVTLAGEDYLSLSTQQITANAINPDNLAAADFGDFTCNGTTCSLDVAVGGDTGWSTSTAFGSQVILYPAGTTYDVLFGANSTTTAPFWWDVSATSTYIGNGGSGDSAVQLGDDNNAWTFGKDDTDGSFAIASSTTLGTNNLLTIQKNATTTLQNANGIDFTDGTNGMRIYFGGTTTTLEFY